MGTPPTLLVVVRDRVFWPIGCALVLLMPPRALSAVPQTVTPPAAASIQDVTPFYSDVRVFDISHTSTLVVTATYRCFMAITPISVQVGTIDQLFQVQRIELRPRSRQHGRGRSGRAVIG